MEKKTNYESHSYNLFFNNMSKSIIRFLFFIFYFYFSMYMEILYLYKEVNRKLNIYIEAKTLLIFFRSNFIK
jgi:hypothetical protein